MGTKRELSAGADSLDARKMVLVKQTYVMRETLILPGVVLKRR